MRFVLAILLSLLVLPCAAVPPETVPSAKTAAELARIEAQASVSPIARRLFAAARHVPRREIHGSELPDAIYARGGENPQLVLDSSRLPQTTDIDAELLLVLNSARVVSAFPIPVVEAEQAAWQQALQFAVERGAEDPSGFGMRLLKAAREGGARIDALEKFALPPRTPWEPSQTPVLNLPAGALERTGLLLALFERDPQRFYWAIENGTAWPRGSARLAEIEDLYALRASQIAELKAPPEGPYAMLGGRRYPGPLVRAAFLLRGSGEVERLREALEAYDGAGLVAVRVVINRWRKAVGR